MYISSHENQRQNVKKMSLKLRFLLNRTLFKKWWIKYKYFQHEAHKKAYVQKRLQWMGKYHYRRIYLFRTKSSSNHYFVSGIHQTWRLRGWYIHEYMYIFYACMKCLFAISKTWNAHQQMWTIWWISNPALSLLTTCII